MKSGIRILAIDDARLVKEKESILIIGVVGRLGIIEGVLSFGVKPDGSDSTEKIIGAVKKSRFMDQIKLVVTNGTTVAGMNIIDIVKISSELKLPVVAITRKRPHPNLLKNGIRTTKPEKYLEKIKTIDMISKKSKIARIEGMYVQYVGVEKGLIMKHIDNSIGLLRLAHMIASGVSGGESKGRV